MMSTSTHARGELSAMIQLSHLVLSFSSSVSLLSVISIMCRVGFCLGFFEMAFIFKRGLWCAGGMA